MDAEADEPASPRRGNGFAVAALLAWLVALVLPWWQARNVTYAATFSFGLWDAGSTDLHGHWVWASVVPAVLAPLPLFVRVAANSIRHEPAAWRRDVGLAAMAMALALAFATQWPVEVPFWGSLTYEGEDATLDQKISTSPASGWWLGLVAVALAAAGWFLSRRARGAATEK